MPNTPARTTLPNHQQPAACLAVRKYGRKTPRATAWVGAATASQTKHLTHNQGKQRQQLASVNGCIYIHDYNYSDKKIQDKMPGFQTHCSFPPSLVLIQKKDQLGISICICRLPVQSWADSN
jgi:hypothetical protein